MSPDGLLSIGIPASLNAWSCVALSGLLVLALGSMMIRTFTPAFQALDDFVRVARVGHEPEAQVDLATVDRLVPDEREHFVATVLVGDVAQVRPALRCARAQASARKELVTLTKRRQDNAAICAVSTFLTGNLCSSLGYGRSRKGSLF